MSNKVEVKVGVVLTTDDLIKRLNNLKNKINEVNDEISNKTPSFDFSENDAIKNINEIKKSINSLNTINLSEFNNLINKIDENIKKIDSSFKKSISLDDVKKSESFLNYEKEQNANISKAERYLNLITSKVENARKIQEESFNNYKVFINDLLSSLGSDKSYTNILKNQEDVIKYIKENINNLDPAGFLKNFEDDDRKLVIDNLAKSFNNLFSAVEKVKTAEEALSAAETKKRSGENVSKEELARLNVDLNNARGNLDKLKDNIASKSESVFKKDLSDLNSKLDIARKANEEVRVNTKKNVDAFANDLLSKTNESIKNYNDGLKEGLRTLEKQKKIVKDTEKERLSVFKNRGEDFSRTMAGASAISGMVGVNGSYFSGLGSIFTGLTKSTALFKGALLGLGAAIISAGIAKKLLSIANSAASATIQLTGLQNAMNFPGWITGIREITDYTKQLSSSADQVGASISNVAVYSKALERAGLENDAFNKRTGYLLSTVQKAYIGESKEAENAIKRLGLNITELKNMKTDEMFLTVAKAIGEVKNSAEQAQISTALFERSGYMLLGLFNNLDKSLDESRKVLGSLPELLKENRILFMDISNNMGDLSLKGKQFFAGFLNVNGANINKVLENILNFDMTSLGERFGKLFFSSFRKLSEGDYGGFITDFTIALGDALEKCFIKATDIFSELILDIDWERIGYHIGENIGTIFGYAMISSTSLKLQPNPMSTLKKYDYKREDAERILGKDDMLYRALYPENKDFEYLVKLRNYQQRRLDKRDAKRNIEESIKPVSVDEANKNNLLNTYKSEIDKYISIAKNLRDTLARLNKDITVSEEERKDRSLSINNELYDAYERIINNYDRLIELDPSLKEAYDKKLEQYKTSLNAVGGDLPALELQVSWNRSSVKAQIDDLKETLESLAYEFNQIGADGSDSDVVQRKRKENLEAQLVLVDVLKDSLSEGIDTSRIYSVTEALKKELEDTIKRGRELNNQLNNIGRSLDVSVITKRLRELNREINALERDNAILDRQGGNYRFRSDRWNDNSAEMVDLYKRELEAVDKALKNTNLDDSTRLDLSEKREEIENALSDLELEIALKIDRDSFEDNLRDQIRNLDDEIDTLAESLSESLGDTVRDLNGGMSDFLFDTISGAKTAEEAMTGFAKAMGESFLRATTDAIASFIMRNTVLLALNSIFNTEALAQKKAADSQIIASETTKAAAITAANTPAAAMSSISSWGAAAAIGVAALIAALAIVGVTAGFREGGRVAGRRKNITVNEEGSEYVVSAKSPLANDFYLDYANKGGLIDDLIGVSMQGDVRRSVSVGGSVDTGSESVSIRGDRQGVQKYLTVRSRADVRNEMIRGGVVDVVYSSLKRRGAF